MRIAIIGNGIVANLAALYFNKRLPESTEIVLIGNNVNAHNSIVFMIYLNISRLYCTFSILLFSYPYVNVEGGFSNLSLKPIVAVIEVKWLPLLT